VAALLSMPPLALAAFAFTTAALLAEEILRTVGLGGSAELAPLFFWLGVSGSLGVFWLAGALGLAGLRVWPAGRLASLGAFATLGLGAILARVDHGDPLVDGLALGVSATCFATFFLLRLSRQASKP
jgi:hypothetical protein